MDNNTTTSTESTTTTPAPEEEVIEHVKPEVICPGYKYWGDAPVTLFTLMKGGYNPLLFLL